VEFPPHEALLAVAVSADANTEKAEAAQSKGREATVACSSRTRPPTDVSTLARNVDIRLPEKGNSNSDGARPVH
jgi:hypothetical protein